MNEYNEQVLKEAMKKIVEEEHKELLKEMEIAKTIPEIQVKEGEAEAFVEKYMPRKSNKKKTLMRVASIAVAVLVCFSAVTLSVDGLRNRFTEFLSNFSNSDHASVDIGNSKNDELLLSYKGQYVPTYIPEGYVISDVSNDKVMCSLTLESEEGKVIILSEQSADVKTRMDTEGADSVENIEVNNMKGLLVIKNGVTNIVIASDSIVLDFVCSDPEVNLKAFAQKVEKR